MGLISHIVAFGLGGYCGIFLSQNYEIPKVDEPNVILEKIKTKLDEILKPKST